MKNFTKKALLTIAIVSSAHIAVAQQLPPQKVLNDLTAEQVKEINALGGISNKEVVSPVYDFKLSKILTPAQLTTYNQEKDGARHHSPNGVNYQFNIDSK